LYELVLAHGPRSSRKTIPKHRETAKGFRLSRLVLKNVPVLGELAVLDADNVGVEREPL